MDRAEADNHIQELGRVLGLPELTMDEAGTCILSLVEGALLPILGYNRRTLTIDVMICLDDVVPTAEQMGRLMEANFAWLGSTDATLATAPKSGALVIQRRCGSTDLENGLAAVLESLVGVAQYWSGEFRQDGLPATAADQLQAALDQRIWG